MSYKNQLTQTKSLIIELSNRVPAPDSVCATGLHPTYLCELVAKHLHNGGILNLAELVNRIALEWNVLEEILDQLRGEAYIEIKGPAADESALRYSLTEKGILYAKNALTKDGYVGVAPVTVEQYQNIVQLQDVHLQVIDKEKISATFEKIVIDECLLAQLGAAINSNKAIFIYGPPGTGKSYLCGKLSEALLDHVLIPNAIYQDGAVIQVYDPSVHYPIQETKFDSENVFKRQYDQRYVLCKRPVIVSGGELSEDQLEVKVDQYSKRFTAPLQVKANNGIYLIDDLGRQRIPPKKLFNRWIVPMETHRDYFTLSTGHRMEIPFNVILIFSTNLNPLDLADDAFLRRIGHKVKFDYISAGDYKKIWKEVCGQKNINFNEADVEYIFKGLYEKYDMPMLPCHPRDLIDMALDHELYNSGNNVLTNKALHQAWTNYFIVMDQNENKESVYTLQEGGRNV